MRYYKVYQWSLVEFLEEQPYQNVVSLSTIFTGLGINYSVTTALQSLFTKVYNKYYNAIMFNSVSEDISSEEVQDKYYDFFVRFLNKYEDTKDYYEPLITIYEAKKATLMADIEAETTNEVIFNDTPQTTSGVLSGDTYATTYTKTKSTTKSQMKSPIERMKDIQETLRNYWADFVEEFRHVFLED